MHGAGTAKREREGRRQNPAMAGLLKNGGQPRAATLAMLKETDPAFAAAIEGYRANPDELREGAELLAWLGALRDRAAQNRLLSPVINKDGVVRQSPLLGLTQAIIDASLKLNEAERRNNDGLLLHAQMLVPFVSDVVEAVYELCGGDIERFEGYLRRFRRRLPAVIDVDPDRPPADRAGTEAAPGGE